MGKRQEAALETRKNIVETVKKLLEEKSIENISIEEITKNAGVAKGSFYTYFKRKEDIVSEIALLEFDVLKDLVSDFSGNVYEQICCYLIKSVEIIEKNTLQRAQQWMKSVSAPLDEEQAGIKKYRYDSENIMAIFKEGILNNELVDTTPILTLTEMIMNNYYGAVLTWCMNKGKQGELIKSVTTYCEIGLNALIQIYKK